LLNSVKQLVHGLWKAITGLFEAITAGADIIQYLFAVVFGIIFIYMIAIRPIIMVFTAKDKRERLSWISWIFIILALFGGIFPFVYLGETYGIFGFIIGFIAYYLIIKIAFKLVRFTDKFEG
jgi:hypothetical protein